MRKIPTMFLRDEKNMKWITKVPHPDCKWVFDGEGNALRKYDGTCMKIENGQSFKRREIKKGKAKPPLFQLEGVDKVTGKTVGWVPVTGAPEDKYHAEGVLNSSEKGALGDGTYELIGPKIQKNPERSDTHVLVKHSLMTHYPDAPRDYDGLKEWLKNRDIEGLVFHHPDGRMAKIKKKDFWGKR